MANISPQVLERFSLHAHEPDHREAVIVTVRPGAGDARLRTAGMEIHKIMRHGPVVLGSVDAATLRRIAALDDVVSVEFDGEMHALGS